MNPAEYMAALLSGQATAPGAGAAASLGGGMASPAGKGGSPAIPAGPAATNPLPTDGQTPVDGSTGPDGVDTAALAHFLQQTGGGGGSSFELDPATFNDQLAFVKKYDPNASVNAATIDQGESQQQGYRLSYDASKLPQYDASQHTDWMGDHPDSIVPILGAMGSKDPGVFSYADPSHIWVDPNTGLPVTYSRNININEKQNTMNQSTGGLMNTIANMIVPPDKPWMAPIMVAMLGAGMGAQAAGVPQWMVQLGKTGANMAIKKAGE